MIDSLDELMKMVEAKGQTFWRNLPAQWLIVNESTGGRLENLLQSAEFQIERVTHGPHEVVPLHRHPLVDSYEFPLWGSGEICLAHHKLLLDDKVTPWRAIYVSRNTWHGGRSYDRGGAFLSVQRWHGPILGSVIKSWESKG